MVAISSGLIPLLIVVILFWFFGSNIITWIITTPLLIFSFSSLKTGLLGSDELIENMTSDRPVTRRINREWMEINGRKILDADLKNEINRLTKEINFENQKLAVLVQKYKEDPDTLSELPELTDPTIIVPQTCSRQLLVYLQSKNVGKNNVDAFHDVLRSRFDDSENNPPELKASSFEDSISAPNFTLPDLCKEIIKIEQAGNLSDQQSSYIDSLVDKYFESSNIENLIS